MNNNNMNNSIQNLTRQELLNSVFVNKKFYEDPEQFIKEAPPLYLSIMNSIFSLLIWKKPEDLLCPGRQYLADLAECCTKTVSRHTNRAVKDGLMIKSRRSIRHANGYFTGQSNIYDIHPLFLDRQMVIALGIDKIFPALFKLRLLSEKPSWPKGVPPYYNLLSEEDMRSSKMASAKLSKTEFFALLEGSLQSGATFQLFKVLKRKNGNKLSHSHTTTASIGVAYRECYVNKPKIGKCSRGVPEMERWVDDPYSSLFFKNN